ncbi:MAG: TerB family tellurite resistance protein [Flavobacteriales bacterium]
MAFSKWIGGGLGWAFGGPIGGLLGFAVGAMLDHMGGEVEVIEQPRQRAAGTTTAGDLAMSLVVLTAALMRADGRVTQRELDHVRRFFVQQFGTAHAAELLVALRDVLKRDIAVDQVCAQIRMHMPHPLRLQLMHYLIGLAHADGQVDRAEKDLLKRMAHAMGISDKDLGSLSAMFRTTDPTAAYQILEVPPDASDDDVKKAYRRMAMKYHPDKVAQLGDEVQKAATEKFKKVQEAYEQIQQQRGMK